MNYNTNNNLVGFMNLYKFSPQSASLMQPLFEKVMRDEDFSDISRGHREVLATYLFMHYDNGFCFNVHRCMAEIYLGEGETARIIGTQFKKDEPEKIEGMINIANKIVEVGPGAITNGYLNDHVRSFGVNDREIHDTMLILSLADMMNTYTKSAGLHGVQGMTKKEFAQLAEALYNEGYADGKFQYLNC